MWGIGNGNGNGVYGIWVLYCLIRALCLGRLKVQLLSLQESAEDNGSCHLQWRWAADWLEWARYGKYMKMSREEVDCLAASWYVQPAWPVGQTIRANIYTSRPHTHTPRTTYTGVGSYTQSNPLAKFVSVLVIVAVSLSSDEEVHEGSSFKKDSSLSCWSKDSIANWVKTGLLCVISLNGFCGINH